MWFTRGLFFYVHFCTASSCIRIPIYTLLVYFLELLLHSLFLLLDCCLFLFLDFFHYISFLFLVLLHRSCVRILRCFVSLHFETHYLHSCVPCLLTLPVSAFISSDYLFNNFGSSTSLTLNLKSITILFVFSFFFICIPVQSINMARLFVETLYLQKFFQIFRSTEIFHFSRQSKHRRYILASECTISVIKKPARLAESRLSSHANSLLLVLY